MHGISLRKMGKCFNSFYFSPGRNRKIQSVKMIIFFAKRNQYNSDGKCYDRTKKKCKNNGY